MPGCAALGCSNSAKKGFSMKQFPRDPKRRKQWALKMRRANWTPTDYTRLCEIHFAPEMWEKMRVDGVRKLKANAVPTIFTFKKEEKVPKERKPPKNRSPPTNNSPEHLTTDSIIQDEYDTSIEFEACNPIIKTELSSEIDINEDVKYNITSEDLSVIKEDPLSLFDLSIVKEEKELQSHDLPTDKEEASSYDIANVKIEVSSSTTPELIQIRHLESKLDEKEKNIKALKEIISRLRKDNATLQLKNEKLEKEVKTLRKTVKRKM